MITPDIARKIADRDPDGGRDRPTAHARFTFQRWVIDTYGLGSWEDYVEGNVRADDRI